MINKFKALIVCTICLVFLSVGLTLHAKEIFRASSIPGLPVPDALRFHQFVESYDYPILNGSTLIYVFQGNDSTDIYSYNIEQISSVLLYSVPTISFGALAAQFSLGSTGKKAFLIVEGKLIVTDGTITGTNLIRDFGIGLCCLSTPSFSANATELGTVNNIFYFSAVELEFDENFGDRRIREALWRSDGTLSGTFVITEPETFQGAIMPFRHARFETESTFYFGSRNNLWKIDSSGETELYHSFSDVEFRYLFPMVNVVSTSKGSFFCSSGGNFPEFFDSQLWRIANDGVLSIIAEGCYPPSLDNISDRIYYENNEGLWFTDGTALGEVLIYPYALGRSGGANVQCVIGQDSYRVLNTGERFTNTRKSLIVKISPNNSVSLVQDALSKSTSGITNCLADSFVININEDSEYEGGFVLFNAKTNELSRVTRLSNRGLPIHSSTGLAPGAFFVPGHRLPYYLTPYEPASTIPAIDLLLK